MEVCKYRYLMLYDSIDGAGDRNWPLGGSISIVHIEIEIGIQFEFEYRLDA